MIDKGKSIAVLGGGSSGIAAARLALAGGALVCVFDTADTSKLSRVRDDLAVSGIEMRCGEEALDAPENIDLIVVSPGIDKSTTLVRNFLATGAPMISEIEFAFQRDDRPVVAITGTNGKTTTTELVAHLLNGSGCRAVPAGNYGKPYSEVALETDAWDVVVLEVSSFQLEDIDTFRPDVSVWMNFAPDHMDRYQTLEEYRQAKMRIFENQTSDDTAIVNAVDSPDGINARQIRFSAFDGRADFTFESSKICYHNEALVDFSITKLHGLHNVENVMAAMGAARSMGVSFDVMRDVLPQYDPPAHRYEKVGEINGITFINDSKATNLHALESSLRGQEAKVVLIAGGKNKGLNYGEITDVIVKHVSDVFVIGEMADAIVLTWQEYVTCSKADSLEKAVKLAMNAAQRGQVVLFSPGTSSFDMFSGYIERGEIFKSIINEIKTREGEQV